MARALDRTLENKDGSRGSGDGRPGSKDEELRTFTESRRPRPHPGRYRDIALGA